MFILNRKFSIIFWWNLITETNIRPMLLNIWPILRFLNNVTQSDSTCSPFPSIHTPKFVIKHQKIYFGTSKIGLMFNNIGLMLVTSRRQFCTALFLDISDLLITVNYNCLWLFRPQVLGLLFPDIYVYFSTTGMVFKQII